MLYLSPELAIRKHNKPIVPFSHNLKLLLNMEERLQCWRAGIKRILTEVHYRAFDSIPVTAPTPSDCRDS